MVELRGEVDLHTSTDLRRRITQLLAEGWTRIVVDLSGVEFMDSTGLGVLVGALRRLRDQEGSLALVGPREPVRRVLMVTGLDRVLPTYASLEEALDGNG